MLKDSNATEVTLCELVEHPGGHDGGTFPQESRLGVSQDGELYFSTDFPDDPSSTFCQGDPLEFCDVVNREQALELLEVTTREAVQHAANLQQLLERARAGSGFQLYFADELYDPFSQQDDQE